MSESKLKVGVIGVGIGAAHLEAYSKLASVEIEAVAGLNEDVVKKMAEMYEVPHVFRDYADLLAMPSIEGVSVCLPNVLHAPVTIEALRSGKHVLVEKPLAVTPEEGRQMLKAAKEHERVLMVAFDKRCRSDVQWVKRYIDSGALGRVYYAKAHWMRRNVIPRHGSWFVSKAQAGGGPLIDLGVHVLDMALYLMGEPRALSVSACTYAELGPRRVPSGQQAELHRYEVEDLATAFIRLQDGATLLLEASWVTHSSAQDDFGVSLYGTEGGVELLVKNYGYDNTVRVFTDVEGVPTDLVPRIPRVDGHHEVVARFVNTIANRGEPMPSGEDGLRRAEVIDACYRSSAEGREVEVDNAKGEAE